MLFTSIHRIGPQERGVVTTFGYYTNTLPPGIGFSWPYPIGSVTKVDVAQIRDIAIPGRAGENLILTGDQNVINLAYSVRWNIKSPELYLFQIADPDDTIREVAESAMREVVARVSLDDAIGAGRGDDRAEGPAEDAGAARRLRRRRPDPGRGDQPVGAARRRSTRPSSKSRRRSSARRSLHEPRPRLCASADRRAPRARPPQFERIYAEYRLAPEVTRRRMYYETMEQILQQVDTTIVEAPGVTPYLPLPEIQRRAAARRRPPQGGPAR